MTDREDTVPERPPLLPAAAQPTHITSHLPPLKSRKGSKSRDRPHFLRRKEDSEPRETQSTNKHIGLPTTNTLQTFLTGTDVKHFGHATRHHDHPTNPGHGWRVRKTPIFSGLLAPFSIMLEVPGLTSPWYAKLDDQGIVERFIANPPILTVGLSISLTAAVVANAAIIFRFLEVLRPRMSIALALAGFMLHDVINLVALGTFGGIYGPKHDGLSLSASYYMVCASTVTSTLVTISLVLDYVRTKDFRHAGSGLTQLQKGLVLAGMGLLLYLSLGSVIFVYLIHIDFISALYFSTATVLTVGFGDIVPGSPGGKVLVILYAPIGIVLVALVVSSARNTILETFQAALMARTKERRKRIAQRRQAHKEQKRQDRELRRIMPRAFTFGPNETSQSNAGGQVKGDFAEALEMMESQAAGLHQPRSETETTIGSRNSPSDDPKLGESSEKPKVVVAGDPDLQREISALQQTLLISKQRTEEDFRHFEEQSRKEALTAARLKLVLAASVTAAFWLLGAVAFTYAEKWSYGGAMWFCFIAMITIGYGDYHPVTQLGRGLFVMWGLMGVAVLTILLAVVQDAFGGILHRMLTQSTSRLFDRAEARARKRRMRKEENEDRRRKEEEGEGGDIELQAMGYGERRLRRNEKRKSEPDLRRRKQKGPAGKKSMDSPQERRRHSFVVRVSPPELSPTKEPKEPLTITIPSSILVDPTSDSGSSTLSPELQISRGTAAQVENTLVSVPQKLALAALQTFQSSVQVLQLNESLISQAMTEVPALRHYYNSRQQSSSSLREGEGGGEEMMNSEEALQALQTSIRQTANPEYEKVAKLVVANLEFEHHLRILLEQFQGLKDRVEGFKESQLQRHREHHNEREEEETDA